jgi:GNAT superfamily N-acetyltransferase
MPHIVLEHDPAVEDQRVIDEGFLTAQADRVGDPHLDVFACFLRDERRHIQGGLLGRLWWRWLYVERLWVTPALRGRGYGRHLLERAEAHARQAGCGAAFVDTFDPTALALYRRCGYEVVASLPDFPPGQRQYFLAKTLGPSDRPDRESADTGG